MLCPSCSREMEKTTVRYHTPNGYERKMIVYECGYDSCIEDFTEDEAHISALRAQVAALVAALLLAKCYVDDEPLCSMIAELLSDV